MPKVIRIPATISRICHDTGKQSKRRVAGYARVSTDLEEQQSSYEAQLDYYQHYIGTHEDWEFVGMYSDEGISGTSTKHREGFKKMINDALAGKIDLIVTKSVSRFARNTVDSLTTIRALKANNVECYFEKENIWTFDGKGELLLTIMSSIAQEESRSISENCTWGQRKRLADGKVSLAYKNFLGYDKGPGGKLVINKRQAEVVRKIYAMFLSGLTPGAISRKLTKEGILTPTGKKKWNYMTIKRILTNEKYKGDALLQKTFTVDYLTKKTKKNEGEVPQYYIENDHEAIVSREVFDAVQREFERRRNLENRYSGVNILSSKIVCGECGSFYGSKVWHSTDKYRKVIFRCNKKYSDKGKHCDTPTVTETEIKELFIKAANILFVSSREIVEQLEMLTPIIKDNGKLEKERDENFQLMERLVREMNDAISENAHVPANQSEYRARYKSLERKYDEAKNAYDAALTELGNRQARAQSLEAFVAELKRQKEPLDKFDERLWASLLDKIVAYSRERIVFWFKDGSKIMVGM